jgi:RND superfamily putative drug exporter
MSTSDTVSTRHDPTGADAIADTEASWLGRLAIFALRHRKRVMVLWLVALIAGGVASGSLSKRLKVDFALPGQPGYTTSQQLDHIYGANSGEMPPTLVLITAPSGQRATDDIATIAAALTNAQVAVPGSRVIDYANTHDARFLTKDGRTTVAMVLAPLPKTFGGDTVGGPIGTSLRSALPAGYRVGVTGLNQLAMGSSSKGPGILAETVFGALGALAVLAFVFASFLALVPLAVAAVSITSTLLVVLGLTYLTGVSFIVQFLVALVGLGIAIDYSLLLVTRWREERDKGSSNDQAVINAVQTAGHTVAVSGLTVAIGLLALVVLPVPSLRSVGIGGILIPLVSIVVVLTLLPAILGGIGPKMDWPRVRHEQQASRGWSAWARLIVRFRWAAIAVAAAALIVSIIPIFGMKVGETGTDSLAKTGPARVAYNQLVDGGIPRGILTPLEVLTKSSVSGATVGALTGVKGISAAVLPTGDTGSRDGYADILVIPATETVNNTSLAPVRAAEKAVRGHDGVIGVTGIGPVQQDYEHAVFGNFPLMFAIIAILTFLLLVRAFRSVLLAVKAVLLNLVSLGATFGLLTWFWQEGHGSNALFGIPATGAMTFWIPLMVFAFLFGLSMDYEVFILSRMREEYDDHGDTNSAVVVGLGRTGRLVTSAALILFLAFASLASAPDTDIKVLATGLGAGILLDATIVRALLVPALVALFGRYNWWLPAWLAKPLRVVASPLPAREVRSPLLS